MVDNKNRSDEILRKLRELVEVWEDRRDLDKNSNNMVK